MINLLPPDEQQNFTYARKSSKLVRLGLILLTALAGVWAIIGFGTFYINQSINDLSSQTAKATQELKDQKLDETQARVTDISNNLKLVVKVLSKEILFSKLLKQIGTSMPPNAVLTDLKIAKTEGGIDLTAAAVDYKTASQVQVNLSDPANKIFDKADIVNVACSSISPAPKYPCTITIRAHFASTGNPFMFISNEASASKVKQ